MLIKLQGNDYCKLPNSQLNTDFNNFEYAYLDLVES